MLLNRTASCPWRALLAGVGALWAVSSAAAPGNTSLSTGSSAANVVEPTQITAITDLRFGTIVQPVADGMITIAANGNVTSTIDVSQFPGNRGTATFRVKGDPRRSFVTFVPAAIDIVSGSNRMRVDRFRGNTLLGFAQFDATGNFTLNIGATLSVPRAQSPGLYSGTFELTVLYL